MHVQNGIEISPSMLRLAGQIVAEKLQEAGIQVVFMNQSKSKEIERTHAAWPPLCNLAVCFAHCGPGNSKLHNHSINNETNSNRRV